MEISPHLRCELIYQEGKPPNHDSKVIKIVNHVCQKPWTNPDQSGHIQVTQSRSVQEVPKQNGRAWTTLWVIQAYIY